MTTATGGPTRPARPDQRRRRIADLPDRLLAAAEAPLTDGRRVDVDGVATRQVFYPVTFDASAVTGDDQRGTVTGTITVRVGVPEAVVHQLRFVGTEPVDGVLGLRSPAATTTS